ncbi:MAG: hypothetical protein ACRDID_23310 [Ktedonobacterales bacterium]
MYQSSTLLETTIFVGVLAYIGTAAISPSNIALRRLVGYLAGGLMVVVGVFSFYFGAAKLLTLLFAHIYTFDAFHIEWAFLGAVAIVVGMLLVRQAFRRM